jgi:hypothetical protein
MLMLFLMVVAVCFAASLLPFLFPGALVSALGVVLNAWLGDLLATAFGLGPGSLLTPVPTEAGRVALTFAGVLTVYVPTLAVLSLAVRGR